MERVLRLAALPLALALPLAGQAQDAFVVADATLRAGPAPEYPDITLVPYGTWVDVQGCVGGWQWCDVIVDGARGWLPGDYIGYDYQDQPVLLVDYGPRIGIPIVSFSISTYWDRHYRDRPFYHERDRWYHRHIVRAAPPPPPPKPPGGWHLPPPPHAGGRHHENPPNPPRVPVHPAHPTGGEHHVEPPSPPHVPVHPAPTTGGGPHAKPPNPPHVPVYAPKPAGAPENAPLPPPQHGPPVHTPHPSHPASSASHARQPPEQNPKNKKEHNGDESDNGH
jgi:uncharacterized protein YraI